ncbi:MAG: S41 family peptidase [bacterium]
MKKNLEINRIVAILVFIGGMTMAFASGYFWQSGQDLKSTISLISEVGSSSSSTPVVKGLYKNKQLSNDANFQLFWDAWDLMKRDYVKSDKLTDKDMMYGAIRGLVASAGDPYTVFMNPTEAESFDNDMAGTFEGIGAEIGIKNDRLVVIAPLPDTPAEKAGIRAGDKINAINGEITLGMSTDIAVKKIRGARATEVKLNVTHLGEDKGVEIKIIRGVIIVKSVKTELRKDGIYVITVSNFNNDTEDLFAKAVDDVVAKKPKGLILDLRNNPGGYLDTAISMASYWVESGVIVSEKFSDGKIKAYETVGSPRLKNIKTVVLINQGSASASEIVSGALQDYGKATLIGKQSFGKGSVQALETLKDGSSIKVTVAQWLTPKGNNITEKGITPDKVIDLTPKDFNDNKDPQLSEALKILTPQKK